MATMQNKNFYNKINASDFPGLQTLSLQNKVQKIVEQLVTQARRPGKMAGPGLASCAEASFFLDFLFLFHQGKRKFIIFVIKSCSPLTTNTNQKLTPATSA